MVKIKGILKLITYASVLTGYAAVMRYVEIYISLSFAALLFFSVYLEIRKTFEIPRWILNGISFLVLLFFAFRISAIHLIEPILNALLILAAIKLLEEKKFRDYMQILVLCMFLLVGSSLISLSSVFLIYFSILIILSTFSLILLAYFSQAEDLAVNRGDILKIFHQALLICGITLPLCIVFFIILPRTNYPLFNFLSRPETSRAGFSDEVALGEVSNIQENNQVVLRAEMSKVEEHDLYWRGIVLDTFDGSAWRTDSSRPEMPLPPLDGHQITQTIYLEPYGNRYLFALDKPVHISGEGVRKSGDLTYTLRTPLEKRTRYRAISVMAPWIPETGMDWDRYLQLPPGFSPRILEFVKTLKEGVRGNDWIKTLQHLFTGGGYKYSLQDLPVSETPLEDFLFVYRRGNCEYFASALAVMLRMGGVPSRVVGGYRGGYYNRAGGYYLVLQSNAHVWVEAYLNDGWLRIDPTPPHAENATMRSLEGGSMRLKLMLDTFNYYWNKWVISYDLNKQLQILDAVRSSFEKPHLKWGMSKRALLQYIFLPLLLLTLGFCGYLFHVHRKKGPHEKIVAQFLRKMASHGYEKGKGEGLEEFIRRVEDKALQDNARLFVDEFEQIYYKDMKFTRQAISSLKNHIRKL
ncbi:transglutaminase family protein [Desulforhabdus amnigena]|jgi:transglutaminase-like putative cysteine protease|uniref:Transglutaminase-like domain-containing protein n=1 Tax=Desulforhabdus amnigena TaxID=40218 RepID=A0A9W6FWX1_9BACT|nr:DUF3488 and transglutaminase-like domain-containing protein [Desulforhabdus amnigena]NLJ27141.1 DUF3488 domain-containing transglutaminase family protein [Deltaproteobacteria bacterium]GLI36386.1 hypothetical protein DAMNIGENAA_38190 [Desulforhabdus amnigena]